MTDAPVIDIARIPFSRYGSYLSICHDSANHQLAVHHVWRRFEDYAFTLSFSARGATPAWTASATPWALRIASDAGEARLYIKDDSSCVLESRGLDVRLSRADPGVYGVEESAGRFKIISQPQCTYAHVRVFHGKGKLDGPHLPLNKQSAMRRNHRSDLSVVCEDDRIVMQLDIANRERRARETPPLIERDLETVRREWEAFCSGMPEIPLERRPHALLAWYNLWSSFVRATDVYAYDAMLMSKKLMCSVWSWDHCFNALALARARPRAALEQFLLPFELQAANGALPDMWNPNQEIVWGVTKPPIHGWCFERLMDLIACDQAVLRKVSAHLEKWTDWWLTFRDSDADGIPEYPMGCDSGWDNATVFDSGFFIESPDLSAFLVLQMGALSRIARQLGDASSAAAWDRKAADLLTRLYAHSWIGGRFVAKHSRSHEFEARPTSLLPLMPLTLGRRLDPEKAEALTGILERDFLTANGPATESPASARYGSNGYWRGPIWAPSTYLLADGLRRGGRNALAVEIARRFCALCEKAGGFYENFDALTGEGLCSPGYTWTASVYLLLVWEYLVSPPTSKHPSGAAVAGGTS